MDKATYDIDELTGLASRTGLEQRLQTLNDAPDTPQVSLLLCAMSRFSNVTDSMGSDLGNKVITTTAKRLKKIFAHADTIARTHGDHFSLVFVGEVDLKEQIDLLNDFTQRPLALRGEIVVLSIRAGVCSTNNADVTAGILLHCAEIALHRAKREQIKYCLYEEAFKLDATAKHKLENDLRVSLITNHGELHRGIANKEFVLLYQPIVDIEKGVVNSVEALIRWLHPTRGYVSPAEFIPMSEQIQIMDVLGSWIFKKACIDAADLPPNSDGSRVGVSINVSPLQFIEPDILLKAARDALAESGIDPRLVKVELTESGAFGSNMLGTILALKDMGFKISLDDFGTGYSSLTQLNELPLDYLKLDQSFVRRIGGDDIDEDRRSVRLTTSILSLADIFGLVPIVEGVENQHQLDVVGQAGGHLIQGYFFSKPLPLEEAQSFVLGFSKQQTRGVS